MCGCNNMESFHCSSLKRFDHFRGFFSTNPRYLFTNWSETAPNLHETPGNERLQRLRGFALCSLSSVLSVGDTNGHVSRQDHRTSATDPAGTKSSRVVLLHFRRPICSAHAARLSEMMQCRLPRRHRALCTSSSLSFPHMEYSL